MKTFVRSYDSFPSLFNEFLNTAPSQSPFSPQANVKETESEFQIDLAIPGVNKEDFNIEVKEKSLTVSSEKKTETEETQDTYIRKEFNYSSFSRTFRLPKSVDSDLIGASYDNGILSISLPKKEEAKVKEPRLIAID